MKLYSLNGEKFNSKEVMYDYLNDVFDLPDYFGNNLDALWDSISSSSHETVIELIYKDAIVENLGKYGESFLSILDRLDQTDNYTVNIYYEIKRTE